MGSATAESGDGRDAAAWPPAGFVDRDEACRMFGITSATLKRWERRGLIPRGKRPGGWWKLYNKAEIERLVEEFGALSPPYPDPRRPGCYRLPLTGFDIRRHEAIIDEQSLPLVQGRQFYWNTNGRYAGYVSLARKGETVPLHRMILGITDPELNIVHKNGDPLDCRRENLLVKTLQEQTFGSRKRATHAGRPCSSRFKGVCWDKDRGAWVVNIRRDGRTRYLGRFDDELAAAQKYDEAARELFGEHARLNFPDPPCGIEPFLAAAEDGEPRAAA